ncbi:hypothetical protein QUB68_29470 [Microcoleus sp. A006_D1]|uniref:hypothetical protein n=1 Tax=Microcoleus sp. A006_D1 TaxID=3055267 RepID=UPI002FD20BB0
MYFKKLLLESPKLKISEIFKAIEIAIPSTEIEAAILKKKGAAGGFCTEIVCCQNPWLNPPLQIIR